MIVSILELDAGQLFTKDGRLYVVLNLILSKDDIITKIVARRISYQKKGTSTPASQFLSTRKHSIKFRPNIKVQLLTGQPMPIPRLYSLFIKVGSKRIRISGDAYPKQKAVHVYQSRLIGLLRFNAELRPIGKQVIRHMVFPAYGRDYQTSEDAIQDWNGGKDFSMSAHGGPYTSCRDMIPVVICFHNFLEVTLP